MSNTNTHNLKNIYSLYKQICVYNKGVRPYIHWQHTIIFNSKDYRRIIDEQKEILKNIYSTYKHKYTRYIHSESENEWERQGDENKILFTFYATLENMIGARSFQLTIPEKFNKFAFNKARKKI